VTTTAEVLLGLIALAVVVMAVVQVAVVIVLARLARRVDSLASKVEHELVPVANRLQLVAQSLQHATDLAAVQVERVDRLLAGVSRRTEETLGVVQHAIVGPIREMMGVVAAVRGVVGAFRAVRQGGNPRQASRFDEEDPLFIG
jgi:hypothetical protein